MLEQYDEHRLGNSVAVAARIIYRLSKLVPDNMDRSGLFSFFSKELRASFHYDRFSIFLYDAERDFLTAFTAADGTVVEVFSDTRIAQNTVAWQAIQTRKPVVIKNLASLNWGGAVSLASVGLTATIALPLILNRQVIGTLHVSFVRQPDNLVEILNLLQQLSPVLTTFLFVILTEERRARTQAADRAALDSPCETEAAFPLENSLLETKAMTKVMALARKAAKLHIPVLISGETGTGKEVIARAIHQLSPRRDKPLVKINCAAIPASLLESELFGHDKGAFTGAINTHRGRFEIADGGTLFLDEIGDLPLELQPKLLRVLQEREIERLGGSRTITVNVRVIAATNRDLWQMVEDRQFRSDLFYRLNVFPLELPPLRDRPEDIPLLAKHFTQKMARHMNRAIDAIPTEALRQLMSWDWPGNVRELENVIERAVLLTRGNSLNLHLNVRQSRLLPTLNEDSALRSSMAQLLHPTTPENDEEERQRIVQVLRETNGIVAGPRGAATRLGMKRTTLLSRMQRLGISVREVL